ncbi:NAD(P)-dependent alcohol dehydrogenase [Pseudactinotalea terrae]|uniref:NAD(P)-dependent alcohol dehydrogenase n=1 Tax=Pseudactinotalea terrae TaxID=1743262 RepID=UPI001F502C98|nr:NAD(P)-dependent alcohol dehydrogenase [Pseudactinotalea terrae]
MVTSAPVPPTMRAAFLDGPQRIEIRETLTPQPGPFEVLVRPTSVGLCGSDVHFWQHGRVGDLVVTEPLILGHEVAGVIAAVGQGVDPARIGERVAVDPQRPCRRCGYCLGGQYNLCRDVEFPSAPPVHGAFADYIAVPADFAFELPEGMSDDEAALLEPLSVGIAAVRKAGVVPGSRVLVTGAGPIGVLTAAAAAAFGATEVVVSDPLGSRRAVALAHGATAVLDPTVEPVPEEHFHALVDASGAPRAIDAGIRALRAGGTAVMVGMGSDRIELDLFRVQSRELRLEGLFRYVDTWPTAIALVSSGRVRVADLVTAAVGLDDLDAAMRRNGDADVMKIVVRV